MLFPADYLVIVFYLVFMASIGWFFRRFSQDSSEYFRGGGVVPWWMVGASNYISSFSVWTFTGAVALAYDHGIVVFAIFWGSAIAYIFTAGWSAPRYRQTRVVTIMEIVRARLGRANEQVFTWLKLPMGVILAAIWLYSLAIFCAPAFGFPVRTMILFSGTVVLLMATLGGSWAVMAEGFVQSLVLLPVGIVVAVGAWVRAGGWDGIVARVPAEHWHITAAQLSEFGAWWLAAMLLDKFFQINGVVDSGKYFYVRDGRAARKTALMMLALTAVGPVLWFIPAFSIRAQGTDLAALFPQLARPSEGAYMAMAHQVLPAGLMGLMVTAILSTTLSSMDVGLNTNAGIFVRSVYLRLFRPAASEQTQVRVGRWATVGFGVVVILTALVYSTWTHVTLFSLMLNFQALISTPIAVPLFWSMWVKRPPDWAGWATVSVGLVLGLLVSMIANTGGEAYALNGFFAWVRAHAYAATTLADCIVCSLVFLGSGLFSRAPNPPRAKEIETFFASAARPITPGEIGAEDGAGIEKTGRLCVAYAVFISLLILVPNQLSGRIKIMFCGVFVGLVGWLLVRYGKKARACLEAAQADRAGSP
jgi:Na+/proline symporter